MILTRGLDALNLGEGFEAWQTKTIAEMEAEAITLVETDAGVFRGYFFPDNIQPDKWLKDRV